MSATQTPALQTKQTVNSFSLCLEGFERALRAEQPIQHIENQLLAQLEQPVRLLRWAIVKVETQPQAGQIYWCEGAYLKSCQ